MASWTASAQAQPQLEEGRRLYESGEFSAALSQFAAAELGSGLRLADLAELYELRAMSYFAMGEQDSAAEAIRFLAAVDPARDLGMSLPPNLSEAFAAEVSAIGGPIAIEFDVTQTESSLSLQANVVRDPRQLVRSVQIHTRTPGGAWVVHDGTQQTLAVQNAVDYRASALGPGGAILATNGTEAAPLQHRPAVEPPEVVDTDDGGVSAGVIVGVGLGAVAIAALVTVLLLVLPSSSTQVSAPGPG